MKLSFKQFLNEAITHKYSYHTIQEFIEFFEDDFTTSRPGGRLVIVAKKGSRKNPVFEGKSAEQIAKICQQYFDKTVTVQNWTKKGDKETKIFFDWNWDTPAKAKVLYSVEDMDELRKRENREKQQQVYVELNDIDRNLGKTGGAVGYLLKNFSDYSAIVGVFVEGPAKGSPFVAKNAFNGKGLKKGDTFYSTVDMEYGNCRFAGTTREV